MPLLSQKVNGCVDSSVKLNVTRWMCVRGPHMQADVSTIRKKSCNGRVICSMFFLKQHCELVGGWGDGVSG